MQKKSTSLPRTLVACFQEYDLEQLDLAQHRSLIIERVLAYGNRAEVCWLLAQYGGAGVSDWVRRWGERRLPWRRYNLWCVLLLGLSPPCRSRPVEERIWPY